MKRFVKVRRLIGNVDVWIRPKWITAISEEECIVGHLTPSGSREARYIVFDDMATVGADEAGAKPYMLSRVHFCNANDDLSGSILVAHTPENLVECIESSLSQVPMHPCIGVVVNNSGHTEDTFDNLMIDNDCR